MKRDVSKLALKIHHEYYILQDIKGHSCASRMHRMHTHEDMHHEQGGGGSSVTGRKDAKFKADLKNVVESERSGDQTERL